MTQQEQQEFMENLEAALTWMRAVQEKLKANDNTQGPRDALEARLRETEKIHLSEHEGRIKMDLALAAAENLLQNGDEELRNHTHTQLKDLKSLWEDTCTHIIHCHSRIEWVWLHWGEYLKAYEEFEMWLTRQQRSLDVEVEHQLGLKEKLWQVDQQKVVVSDIDGQAALLERLLDEAAALHNRTQDPSVDSQAQAKLQEDYNDIRDRAKDRLSQLQKIAEEHQTHQDKVHRFQSWLVSKTKDLTALMERDDTAENKLKALQTLDDSVACEEKTLQHIERDAEAVRVNTSPAGAEVVVEEAEELRLGWQRLRQSLCETDEGLRSSLDCHTQYMTRCHRLGEDIDRLRAVLQGLDQELGETQESRDRTDHTEEQIVGQWRKYMGVRNTLAGEESQVELLKAQLKELFRFSEDSRHLSDDVLAVVKEHQSVKCRVNRLCSESESGLRNILQDPLLFYEQWRLMVSQVLEASAEVTDFSHIAMMVQKMELLLKDGLQLQERFSLLQVKGDLLESVFGPERSDGLQGELSAAIRERELLHTQLLQRRSRLQGLISRTKDFGNTYEMIRSKLASLSDKLMVADSLQPDILAKKSQSDQFRVIQKDVEDCEAHIIALETLVSSSQSNRTQFEKLYSDWKHLHMAVKSKVHESEENIAQHENFHESFLNMKKWLMIMNQKLESFHIPGGGWSIEGRQHEAERALGSCPEKELQLQQMEVQGQGVLERLLRKGRIHIDRDMRLKDSWLALLNKSLNHQRLQNVSTEQTVVSISSTSVSERGGTLKGDDEAQAAMTGQGGRIHDNSDGCLLLPAQGDEHVIHTVQEDELSLIGDDVDFPAWSISSKAGSQRGSQDSPARGSDPDASIQGHSRMSVTDVTSPSSIQTRYIETGRVRSGEDAMETGEDLRSGDGGGAFTRFKRSPATPTKSTMVITGHGMSRRREFEAWLSKQNELLSGILSSKEASLSVKEVKIKRDTLKDLRARVPWGQEQFELLLQENQDEAGSGPSEDVDLEELRYRWMLYKSKLKDVGNIRARISVKKVSARQEEPDITAQVQKKPGLLQRVCRLALLFWLLLLALLLLAFLLPLMDEGNSCSLSNNFAHSFNIMLRYNGPPPT
ncbi:LOW QUALITY PROTEIN: nesprin-3 [Pholidichthys leucotaenia]